MNLFAKIPLVFLLYVTVISPVDLNGWAGDAPSSGRTVALHSIIQTHRIFRSSGHLAALFIMPEFLRKPFYWIRSSFLSERAPNAPPPRFTRFPELPAEIRVKVWQYSFPDEGRDVKLVKKAKNTWGAALPVVFHINKESRYEAFRYARASRSILSIDLQPETFIYFNFRSDMLLIGTEYRCSTWSRSIHPLIWLSTHLPAEQVQRIRYLAINALQVWSRHSDTNHQEIFGRELTKFKSLMAFAVFLGFPLPSIRQRENDPPAHSPRYYKKFNQALQQAGRRYFQVVFDEMERADPGWRRPKLSIGYRNSSRRFKTTFMWMDWT